MKFFAKNPFLIVKFIIFIIFAEFVLSMSESNDYIKDLVRELRRLNSEARKEMESALKFTIPEVIQIFRRGTPEQKNFMLNYITFHLAKIYFTKVTEVERIEEYVNKTFVSTAVPNNFLSAIILIGETFQKVFKNHICVNEYGLPREEMFRLADNTRRRNRAPAQTLAEYTFRGTIVYYYDQIIKGFSAWIHFINAGTNQFRVVFETEMKTEFGDEWKIVAEELALFVTRDYYLCNDIKHHFWFRYSSNLVKINQEFDELLDETYLGGWIYTKKNVYYTNILMRVLRSLDKSQRFMYLDYEPFLHRHQEVGVPQFSSCTCTKRDLRYFLQKDVVLF